MPHQTGYPRPWRRILRHTLWTVTALLSIAAFGAATPYVFLALGRIRPNDWAQFGNEGQAYGGIAAVIGMLAIVGVVASLILQARESAATRVHMERAFHADLLNKSLEDPDLLECWGFPHGDIKKLKQVSYVNLIVSYWYAMFEINKMTDADLRRTAANIFSGMPARDYWPRARSSWLIPNSSVSRRFVAIMDEEHRQAVANGPAVRWPEPSALAPKMANERPMVSGLAVGTLCGAAIAGATAAILRHSRLW